MNWIKFDENDSSTHPKYTKDHKNYIFRIEIKDKGKVFIKYEIGSFHAKTEGCIGTLQEMRESALFFKKDGYKKYEFNITHCCEIEEPNITNMEKPVSDAFLNALNALNDLNNVNYEHPLPFNEKHSHKPTEEEIKQFEVPDNVGKYDRQLAPLANEKTYDFKITPDVMSELINIEIIVNNSIVFNSSFSVKSIEKIIGSLIAARRNIVFKVPGF